jgi:hypothetical protein
MGGHQPQKPFGHGEQELRNKLHKHAGWFVFKPKIPILVKFGGSWNRKCRYFFGLFLGQFVVIWYIFSVLVCLHQEKSGNPASRYLKY